MTGRSTGIGRLHVLTDMTLQSAFDHAELARLVSAAGADAVQLRDKRPRSTAWLVEQASAARQAAAPHGARVIVNDRADVALAAEAAGVHLGADDLPPETARRMLGPGRIVGVTVNDLARAARLSANASYLGVGPVFGTESKAQPSPRSSVATS